MSFENMQPNFPGISRRTLLAGLSAGTLAAMGLPAWAEDTAGAGSSLGNDQRFTGMITRTSSPDNTEFPFASLNSFLTPTDQHFVRTHFDTPEIDARDWRLTVEGAVEKPFELSYEELRKLPSVTAATTLECAGNGRVFLKPLQNGIRWELGGISTAEYTGVRLADLLARAGVREGAKMVTLEGADSGAVSGGPAPGVIAYSKSLPLEKAMQPEVLLAYRMNGEELPAKHGFPLRVVVPGWFGTWSVKWLTKIIVTEGEIDPYFQTFSYSVWDRRYGEPSLIPITQLGVKASIARPARNETVPAGAKYRVLGAAWTGGEAQVTKVEISTDGGKTWGQARLLGEAVPFAWRLWEYEWQTPAAGRRVLMARATDSEGRVQPTEHSADLRDGHINMIIPIPVEVR